MVRSRSHRLAPLAALTALLTVVGSMSSAGAQRQQPKPTARQVFAKLHGHQTRVGKSSSPQTDADEAETVRLRGEYQQSITAAPAVVTPSAGLRAAQQTAATMPVYPGTWHEVTAKPFVNDPIQRGANYGVGWGNVTGRMTALTHSGSVVYAGSASGGVWVSTNGGTRWGHIARGMPRLAIGALATDPSDGSIWAGTGEANNSSETQYGVGVYRLARGATTWRRVGGTELDGSGSHRILWANGYVYVATSHGMYRRSVHASAATAWQAVLRPGGAHAVYPPTSDVTDAVVLPGSHGTKILAVVGWAGYSSPPDVSRNGFYVGTGAPASFHRITPTGDIFPSTIGRTSFSVANGWIYAVVQDTSTDDLGKQGVFVSTSGRPAGPWTRIADVQKLHDSGSALDPPPPAGSYYPGVQSDYNQYIVADPANRRHVYLGLEEVFESTNGGSTWKTVGPYWNFGISCDQDGTTPYNCPGTTHPDQHTGMIFDGEFWGGNDGGLWKRPLSWHDRGQWTNLNGTIHTTQNYSIATGTVGRTRAYWGGLQDNGESYTRTDMPAVEQAFTGDGGDTIVDPTNGNRAVEEYTNLDMYVTTDGAVNTLKEISPSCLTATDPPPGCDPNPRFIAPIEMDVHDSTHWVAGGQYVWDDVKGWNTVCSGKEGCDWKKVYDTGNGHQVTALATNGDVTYAAWCGGCNPPTFARGMATNYGGTWHELTLPGVPNRYITALAVDPDNAAHVFASVGSYSRRWIPDAGVGHVFESRDGGATWTDRTGNLPDAPVYKVATAGGRLVVGTEVGTFVDGGTAHRGRWARLGYGLPNVTVWDVTVTSGGLVVAGTHGRGDWQLQLD